MSGAATTTSSLTLLNTYRRHPPPQNPNIISNINPVRRIFSSSSFYLVSSLTYNLLHSLPLPLPSLPDSHNHSHPNYDLEDEDEDENEEALVIGDCLVFEDGIFDDPFLQQQPETTTTPSISPTTSTNNQPTENLIPQDWIQLVDEINLTKKERRKIAQQLEFGQHLVKKTRLKNVNFEEEYLKLRTEKLSQLNPLHLDNPTEYPSHDLIINTPTNKKVDTRVEPKNPRGAIYGCGLHDITEFFNSGNYQDKPQGGRQKLFTKEEKVLVNACTPNLAVATTHKWLPLHTLAASGEFYLVNTLLKHNVDINAADQDGLTALHKAIIGKKHAITNYLLRESANPFVLDKDGASLMHYAVRTASSQAIKTLLLHNLDINLQDNDGWTPLHLAVQSRRTDVVRLLLMKGANKTVKNQDGLTPLELCIYSGRDAKTYELIKLLKKLPRQLHR